MDIAACAELINKFYVYLENFKKNGFNQVIIAKELADELSVVLVLNQYQEGE